MDRQLGQQLKSRLTVSWLQFRESRDPGSFRVVLALLLTSSALAIFLLAGPNPWDNSIVKRIAAGRELKLEHFITIGLWWGAAAGFISSLIALATVKWWSRPATAVFPDLTPAGPQARRWTLWFALAAVLLAVWPRANRLDHSLWNDEEYHLRTYALGKWQPQDDGTLKFDALTWSESIFSNEKGNNHLWSAMEARTGHLLGGGSPGQDPDATFSETSLRLIPFTTGILTVGVLVLLGAAMGSPRAGLAAGLILALNPWHVRWSVEIRGYSTMLFAICTALLCLLRALQTNRWRWWLGFAAAQTLILLCFAGSVYVVAAQNVMGFSLIGFSRNPVSVRLSSASRLLTAGIFSFIPVALLYGPHVPQIAAYLKSAHEYAPIGWAWMVDLWSHLVTGLRPASDPPGTSNGMGLPDLVASQPWKLWIIQLLLPMVCLGGLLLMLVKDWRTRFVAGTLLLAGSLAIVHNALSGTAFLTWYVLYLLPLFALSLAWAAWGVVQASPKGLHSIPVIAAGLYGLLVSPALSSIMNVPRQPIREAILAMRGISPALHKADPQVLTASFGGGARQMLSYDPRLQILKSPADLQNLINQSIAGNHPLFLCIRGPLTAAAEDPELYQAVVPDPRWRLVDSVDGMEAMLSYDVYRFSPDAMPAIRLNP